MALHAVHPNMLGAELKAHAVSYHRFMLTLKWAVIALAALIAFATIAFATSAGVFAGLVAGILVFALGVFAMTHGLAHSTESDRPLES